MTTKKKTNTKAASTKGKAVTEPATATKTVKASKKVLDKAAQAAPAPQAEAPVAPTVAAAIAQQPKAMAAPMAPKAEQPVAKAEATQAAAKPALTIGMFQKRLYEKGFYGGHWDGHYGPMTKQAVRDFQANQGLRVDGEPTPETLAALGF